MKDLVCPKCDGSINYVGGEYRCNNCGEWWEFEPPTPAEVRQIQIELVAEFI